MVNVKPGGDASSAILQPMPALRLHPTDNKQPQHTRNRVFGPYGPVRSDTNLTSHHQRYRSTAGTSARLKSHRRTAFVPPIPFPFFPSHLLLYSKHKTISAIMLYSARDNAGAAAWRRRANRPAGAPSGAAQPLIAPRRRADPRPTRRRPGQRHVGGARANAQRCTNAGWHQHVPTKTPGQNFHLRKRS